MASQLASSCVLLLARQLRTRASSNALQKDAGFGMERAALYAVLWGHE